MKAVFISTTETLRRVGLSSLASLRRPAHVPVGAHPNATRPLGQIVPARSVAGQALVSVVAIMSFLACLTVGAVALISDASRDWQDDLAREITVQVRPIEEVDTDAEVEKAAALVRTTPGVGSAEVLSVAENARLLEPWLGSGLNTDELPLPRLIVVDLADPAKVDLDALGKKLRDQVRGASLDDHRAWTERLKTMARATVLIGVGILLLVFAATVFCVIFATRGAMAGNRDIVSVLHFVGAEDRFIATEFQRHFMILGLQGGMIGAAAAALLFVGLSLLLARYFATPEADQVALFFGRFSIGPTGYFGALAVAFAIAVMTAVTSRITVFRYLAEVE